MSDIPTQVRRVIRCENCNNAEMELQPYKHPYITHSGKAYTNINVDVYICPCCGREKEILPNEEDGYSAGAGLFCDE